MKWNDEILLTKKSEKKEEACVRHLYQQKIYDRLSSTPREFPGTTKKKGGVSDKLVPVNYGVWLHHEKR